MADIIGPQQYSQILRQENEGGTPMAKTSLLGGVNWSGIQGGGADTPQAPGGQFGEQANIDASAVNQLMSVASKTVKEKVEKASNEYYWKGVQAAANGEAIENLHAQKVKGGFWARLVPDATLEQGYHDFTDYTNLQNSFSSILNDRKKLAEMSPEDANKLVVNTISGVMTDDPARNAYISKLATPMASEVFKQHAYIRQEYLHEQDRRAGIAASISSIRAAQITLLNTNPENAAEARANANMQVAAALMPRPNETMAESDERRELLFAAAAQDGNPLLFTSAEEAGAVASMNPKLQAQFYTMKDNSINAARAKYIEDNAEHLSEAQFRMRQAGTTDEALAIAREESARFSLLVGAPEGTQLFDEARILSGKYDSIANNQEATARLQNANTLAQLNSEFELRAMNYALNGDDEGYMRDYKQMVAMMNERGLSVGGLTDPAAYQRMKNSDPAEAERKRHEKAMLDRRLEAEAKKAARDSRISTAVTSISVAFNPDVSKRIETRTPFNDLENIDEAREALLQATANMDPKTKAEVIAKIGINSAWAGKFGTELLRNGIMSDVEKAAHNAKLDVARVEHALVILNHLKGLPGGANVITDAVGSEAELLFKYQQATQANPSGDRAKIWEGLYQEMYKFDYSPDVDRNDNAFAVSVLKDALGVDDDDFGDDDDPATFGAPGLYEQQRTLSQLAARLRALTPGITPQELSGNLRKYVDDNAIVYKGPRGTLALMDDMDPGTPTFKQILANGKDENGNSLDYNPQTFGAAVYRAFDVYLDEDTIKNNRYVYRRAGDEWQLIILDSTGSIVPYTTEKGETIYHVPIRNSEIVKQYQNIVNAEIQRRKMIRDSGMNEVDYRMSNMMYRQG